MLEARQTKLLFELQALYPIEKVDSGYYAIRGFELPSDLSIKDEEHIATGLGYVAHLILLLSKYLDVILYYYAFLFI